eukprot:4421532-Prymnesium_polylepis.1
MRSCKTRRNPHSHRCVNGEIGRHIIGRRKRCKTVGKRKTKKRARQTRHTFRHVTKTRAHLKRSGTKKRNDLIPICVPQEFEHLAEKCACNQIWLKKSKIGSGAYGNVYKACCLGRTEYAVKIQPSDKYANAEIQAYMALRKSRITPKLYAAWTCKGKLHIVMEKLEECEPSLHRVQALADKMAKLGWLHCDLHAGNVMCTRSNRIVLVDFGLSVQRGRAPYATHPHDATTLEGSAMRSLLQCPKTVFPTQDKMLMPIIDLPKSKEVVAIGHEPHSREFGYVALDCRKQYLFVATNLRTIGETIDSLVGEEIGRTSMFDSASANKRGRVGSF